MRFQTESKFLFFNFIVSQVLFMLNIELSIVNSESDPVCTLLQLEINNTAMIKMYFLYTNLNLSYGII